MPVLGSASGVTSTTIRMRQVPFGSWTTSGAEP
jgi:hypothetical protein